MRSDPYIVLVIYKCELKDSQALSCLKKITKKKINLLLFDNSPFSQKTDRLFAENTNINLEYIHFPENPGLSKAYNYALKKAEMLGLKWLLLLDQDSLLTQEYLEFLQDFKTENYPIPVVAVIPKVISIDKKPIAPSKMSFGGFNRQEDLEEGIVNHPITGINSGTILNIDFIQSLGGFNNSYPLDMLDHWYYREIYKRGFKCYLINAKLIQDLSVFGSIEENVSLERYSQMLNAEFRFIKDGKLKDILFFKIRLIVRVSKQIWYTNNGYMKLTLKKIFF